MSTMETNPTTPDAPRAARVFVVEDHPVVREGLTLLIGSEADLSVCGSAASIAEALARIQELSPDVVVVDLVLEDGNGLDLVKELHQRYASLPMLVLSMHAESTYAERALRAGAKGYIMKSEAMDKVRAAIRRVLKGEIYVSENMVSRMLDKLVHMRLPAVPSLVDSLTDREFQVFRLIADGVGPSEIARQLDLSVKTVETHREHIKNKLGLKNGTELTRYALQWQSEGR
jgi:DNA-binding NarL/FixJ family response regulator